MKIKNKHKNKIILKFALLSHIVSAFIIVASEKFKALIIGSDLIFLDVTKQGSVKNSIVKNPIEMRGSKGNVMTLR